VVPFVVASLRALTFGQLRGCLAVEQQQQGGAAMPATDYELDIARRVLAYYMTEPDGSVTDCPSARVLVEKIKRLERVL